MMGLPPLPNLAKPIAIGTAIARNRVLMSGMHLGFDTDSDPYASLAAFFERRARGGAGTIVVGGCSPDKIGASSHARGFTLATDDLIPRHAQIAEAIQRHGALAILQLCPFGREAFHRRLVAPSPIRAHANPFRPHEMTAEEIELNLAAFVDAVCRAQHAGYDGVEIVGSQGFLVHQFLAPRSNRRTDAWGGNYAGRSRYARELTARSFAATGGRLPLIFRVPGCDFVEGGVPLQEALELTSDLVTAGVSLINIGIGWHDAPVPSVSMEVPPAAFAPLAPAFRPAASGAPIVVSNRINDLRIAERILEEGLADMVAVGRPLLADPDLVNKSFRRSWSTINTCIACNQDCLDRALTGRRVGCILNPECGRELARPVVAASVSRGRRRFEVIGGGLAGMSAALWLRRHGAEVTLHETDYQLGGQLQLARRIPGKEIFAETLRYFETSLRSEGVRIELGRRWTPEDARTFAADYLVVATGARPRRPTWLPASDGRVLSYKEAIIEDLPVGRTVAILGAGAIAVDLVKYCAHQSTAWRRRAQRFLVEASDLLPEQRSLLHEPVTARIYVISRSRSRRIGSTIGITTRWIHREHVDQTAQMVGGMLPTSYREGILNLEGEDGERQAIAADTVIYAIGQEEDRSLPGDDLRDIPHSVIGLGQHRRNRYSAGAAIRQGFDLAVRLFR